MNAAVHATRTAPALQRKSSGGFDRRWGIALGVSLILHALFMAVSLNTIVNDASHTEDKLETLFKVRLDRLESRNFVSRPTQQQLRNERERALEREVEEQSRAQQRSVADEIALAGPQFGDESLPTRSRLTSDQFSADQSARDLITTDVGKSAVRDFERNAGADSIQDSPGLKNKVALMGRGTGSGRRILANLAPPSLDAEPSVRRDIQDTLLAVAEPPAPEARPDDAPILLPPVTELLPSPDLLQPSQAPSTLPSEQKAKEQMEKKYVKLDDLLDVQLETYHHLGGDGYFHIRIRPKGADERLRVLPKDVVFVLDASRSMGRRRLNSIKREVETLLDRLRPNDRFNVVGFKGSVHMFTDTLATIDATTVQKARDFLQDLESSGHTDIYKSLEPLVQLGVERARPLILILFSDGRPTVGVVDSRNIINNLTQHLGPSTSIFCLGTGQPMNRYLLDMLAFRNRGLVAFEPEREDLSLTIQSIYGYIEDPVLLQVKADFGQLDTREVYPKRLPDLFLKGDLQLWGKLPKELDSLTLRLVGEAFDEKKETIMRLPIPERDNGTFEIARRWAFHKIYNLVGQMVQVGEKPEIMEEIQSISKTYNVVTPYSEQAID